jgi:hypothetical protein
MGMVGLICAAEPEFGWEFGSDLLIMEHVCLLTM